MGNHSRLAARGRPTPARWRHRVAVGVAGLAAALVGGGGAFAVASTAGAATPAPQTNRPAGIYGVVPSSGSSAAFRTSAAAIVSARTRGYPCGPLGAGCGTLDYHSGPVMGTPQIAGTNTVYAIFWAPPGTAKFPTQYEELIARYLTNVAATDGRPTNTYANSAQYWETVGGTKKHIHYDVHFGGVIRLTTRYPRTSTGCSASGTDTSCVSDAQIHHELASLMAARHLPSDLAHLYMFFFPPKVETCIFTGTFGGTVCSAGASNTVAAYCGYHSWFGGTPLAGGTPTPPLYADMPFPYITSAPDRGICAVPPTESPNHTLEADTMISVISHENNEAITDPEFTGWWNNTNFQEIGDQCAYLFGTPLGGSGGTSESFTPGTEFNQLIDLHGYYTQTMWSNENNLNTGGNGCVQGANLPTASFTASSLNVKWRQPVYFTGSASYDPAATGLAYSWNFGTDNATASGAFASYTYSRPGLYKVSLTVTDADGWSATSSQYVRVTVTS
jgi:hypothetical protein